uniref:Uncharacterized protein n=1 Tax=Arundo donax TaxID=35708 RepID=A0A0A9AUP5_ARUDO
MYFFWSRVLELDN